MALRDADDYVCSVKFTREGNCVAVGTPQGIVELWDVGAMKKVRNGSLDSLTILYWILGNGHNVSWHNYINIVNLDFLAPHDERTHGQGRMPQLESGKSSLFQRALSLPWDVSINLGAMYGKQLCGEISLMKMSSSISGRRIRHDISHFSRTYSMNG